MRISSYYSQSKNSCGWFKVKDVLVDDTCLWITREAFGTNESGVAFLVPMYSVDVRTSKRGG